MFIFYNKIYIFSLFSVIILFFIILNSSRIYIKWLTIEFSTIIIIRIINIKSNNKIVRIIYFIISSISSLLIIIIISLNYSQIFILKNYIINFLLNLSIFLKIGFFPFCFWIIYIYKISSWNQILIISTFIKFIPIYFFSSTIFITPYLLNILILNNIFVALYTNKNFSIKKLFGCSSIFNSLFFYLIIHTNKNLFILLILIYLNIFFILIYFLNFYNINNLNFRNLSIYSYFIFIILLLIYSSLPLFFSFIFKWEFIFNLNLNLSYNLIILLLLLRIFIIWNYFILLKYILLKLKFNKIILNFEIFNINIYILFIISFFSTIFILFNLI